MAESLTTAEPSARAGRPCHGMLRRRSRRLRRAAWAIAILVAIPVLGWIAFAVAVAWWPYPEGIDHTPPPATWVADRNGVPLAAFVAADEQWRMPLSCEQ